MYCLTDGTQSETLYINLMQWHPEAGGSIICSLDGDIILYVADKEQVESMDVHAGIAIDIRDGEEIGHIGTVDCETGFFKDLPYNPLLGILIIVHKSTRQVKRIFCRFLASAGNQQLFSIIQDESRCRGPRILVISKPAF